MNSPQYVAVGIVTYNNLPLIQQCFASWRDVTNGHLVVFDNGSNPDVVAWLRKQPIDRLITAQKNMGLCFARNRIIEYCRDRQIAPFVLLADSDVKFHPQMVEKMLELMATDQNIGIVGFEQANKGFPFCENGSVEEIANECQLTRLDMWLEIGGFPEKVRYYSGDSWKSTIANMHGWKTKIIPNEKGYDHFQHGSQANPGVKEQMIHDAELWKQKENQFCAYWRTRILLGKGNLYRPEPLPEDSDINIRESRFVAEEAHAECLIPSKTGLHFTNQLDVEALIMLARLTPGNILEVGCHEGITTMQFAYNFPERTVYGLDYSGKNPPVSEHHMEEQPLHEQIGRKAKPFRNVVVFDHLFADFDLAQMGNIGFVYYDADLSYGGVKAATEKILEHFFANPSSSNRVLVWHDYTPKRHPTTHPEWLRVGEYVRREIAHVYEVHYLHWTNIAYMIYPGARPA